MSATSSASDAKEAFSSSASTTTSSSELPVVFLSHAAPVLFMPNNSPVMGSRLDCGVGSPTYKWYEGLAKTLGLDGARKPKAIVMVSAHWETRGVTAVSGQDKYPKLFYDYYGFDSYLYDIHYPAPGNSKLAQRVADLLTKGPYALPSAVDDQRNLDHAAFIPLKLIYPDADVPVLQVSLATLDPDYLIKVGESLAPLRKEGVLIMGSGQATHNSFSSFGSSSAAKATTAFVGALTAALKTDDVAARHEALRNWRKLPHSSDAHPREEHLAPLFAVVGAAGKDDKLHVVGDHTMMGAHSLRTFAFGDISGGAKAAAQDGAATAAAAAPEAT